MERIPTKRLLVEFDRKFDRFSSQKSTKLSLVQKLNILNEAQMILYGKRADLVEVNDKISRSLIPFEIKEKKLKIIERTKDYVVAAYPDNFYKRLRQRVLASKECCSVKEKVIPISIERSDKLDNILKDSFYQPSYSWEIIIGNDGSKGLYIWHNNDCEIKEVIIDYLRRPDELHDPSMDSQGQYEDWNGIIRKKAVNCEFSQNFDHIKIVDIAVLLARADMGDIRDLQTSISAIANLDNNKF